MTTAASSCACTSSELSIEQRGGMPPAAAIAAPASALPARCHSVRAAEACAACAPLVTSSMSGGMPVEREMSPCSGSLLVAIESSACAASRCATVGNRRAVVFSRESSVALGGTQLHSPQQTRSAPIRGKTRRHLEALGGTRRHSVAFGGTHLRVRVEATLGARIESSGEPHDERRHHACLGEGHLVGLITRRESRDRAEHTHGAAWRLHHRDARGASIDHQLGDGLAVIGVLVREREQSARREVERRLCATCACMCSTRRSDERPERAVRWRGGARSVCKRQPSRGASRDCNQVQSSAIKVQSKCNRVQSKCNQVQSSAIKCNQAHR